MKFKRSERFSRLLCSCLALILTASLLSSCGSRKLSPTKTARQVVGNVGEYEVTYEELYFLASNYKTDGMTEEALWELVNENIVKSYAILTLCEQAGVEYDEKELKNDIDDYIDNMIATEFGDRSEYVRSLEENGATEHYMRASAAVELYYAKLPSALALNGELAVDEKSVTEHIKNNFVRTHHFLIANNEGDDAEKNLELAKSCLAELDAGRTTVYKLIGSKYNEDIMPAANGYTFARGSMAEAYENAAFSLKVGEHSGIVTAKGELANGEYVDCYYIIERLKLDDSYISEHFSELYDSYTYSVIDERLEKLCSELKFTSTYDGDILSLEYPGVGNDVTVTVVICCCAAAVVGIAVACVLLVHRSKKKRALAKSRAQLKAATADKSADSEG